MKKIIYSAAAVAMALLAGSCAKDNLVPTADNGKVTYTVTVPGGIATKAIGDAKNVDQLIYEVWLTDEAGKKQLDGTGVQKLYQSNTDLKDLGNGNWGTTITLDLVNDQHYTILFWAQNSTSAAYDTKELTAVTYAKDAYSSNDEGLAAFYAVDCISDGDTKSRTIYLHRPFAQLNLGTTNTTSDYDITLVESAVAVAEVPTVFNVATSETDPDSYKEISFAAAAVPADPAKLTIKQLDGTEYKDVEYEYVAMNYVFAGDNISVTYDITAKIGNAQTVTINNTVPNVPLKENYRTNIIGNLLTSKTDYTVIVDKDFADNNGEDSNNIYVTSVSTSQDLEAALRQDKEHIVVNLLAGGQTIVKSAAEGTEFFVNMSAWEPPYYFGGESTKSITINANGNTINFVHNNSDWNYIRFHDEEAKWYIKDAHLTNSGHNNGPWNRHDIRFYNAVEFENVTSDKAIAVLNDAVLNNVNITEDTGVYGLWITAQGQTVSLDNVNISSERGIKVADEYIGSPASVTINVDNSTFTTSLKAAVLVTSSAGAVINWGKGNDIANVAADQLNAVWVDEDRKEYADLVTVNGSTKIIEGASASFSYANGTYTISAVTADALSQVLADAENNSYSDIVIALSDDQAISWETGAQHGSTSFGHEGKVTIKGGTFIATGDGIGPVSNGENTLTFENVTIIDRSESYAENSWELGYLECSGDLVFTGCNFTNAISVSGKSSFTGCTFNSNKESEYDVWVNAGTATFTNCTFNGYRGLKMHEAYSSEISEVTVDGCTFGPLSVKPGIAIGDLNAETTVTVKNSSFNDCQAGDQGLYIYESDTNVDTFTFVLENNSVNTTANNITDIKEALAGGSDVVLNEDVTGAGSQGGYNIAGLTTNGGTIDGNGNTLTVTDANSLWDCAVYHNGGTVKNLTIGGAFRGIFTAGCSSDIIIDNVIIDNVCYTISSDGSNPDYSVIVTNSTLNGWTSYTGGYKSVSFTDCKFGRGTGGYQYAYCRPYSATTFTNCEFEEGFGFDATQATSIFVNCTVNGTLVTAENVTALLGDGAAGITCK